MPMLSTNVCARTLLRALDVAGDERRLARWLQVPIQELRSWITGQDLPPTGVFLAAVDILQQGDRRKGPRDPLRALHEPTHL